MPPRSAKHPELQQNSLNQDNPARENHHGSSHDENTSAKQTNNKRLIFFRIGPLRFGVHGIVGIASTFVVSFALYKSYMNESIPFWSAFATVLTSTINSVGSYDLLHQVPNTSKIASWIFPPHKDAFKRTIAIVGYLNIRLVHEWQWILGKESLLFPVLLFLYTNYHFFPRNPDWFNGNTWVFVFPMFLGFGTETLMQFPSIEWHKSVDGALASLDFNWDAVHKWNKDRVDETYLLLTLLCALQIAFMFTIAFRGRMSIKICYWLAALEVGFLCIRLIHA